MTEKRKLLFKKPMLKKLGSASDLIRNEFRPGSNDSIPAVENINTDG